MIKILIIGNGFDRAHNLPTNYSDYLYMNEIVGKYINDVMWTNEKPPLRGTLFIQNSTEYSSFYNFGAALGRENTERFYDISQECFWIQHFLSVKDNLGEKWLDFEEEIEDCIRGLVDFFRHNNGSQIVTIVPMESLSKYLIATNKMGQISEKELFDILHKDYDLLIESLRLYMGYYINDYNVNPMQIFSLERYDRILSFNYTNTFERLYPNNGYCCYIHGNAAKDKIVLGYQNQDEADLKRQKEEILYQKYYQRIVNRTDNKYLEWISDNSDFTELTIYGHSLSPADGDILRAFTTKNLTKTIVYCLNEDDRAEKIRNLAMVLGAGLLQAKAGGPIPSIEFRIIDHTETSEATQLIR